MLTQGTGGIPENYEVPKDLLELNINREVLVRITETGEELVQQYYQKYGFRFNGIKRDENGFTRMQLHEVANIFGSGMRNGADIPIEPTIYVIPDGWQASMDDSQNHISRVVEKYSKAPKILDSYNVKA